MGTNLFDAPLIMGVLNITPDSFSDGGKYFSNDLALQHAISMVEEGADVIDIGAESSRPGAKSISIQEELDRILPVIELIKKHSEVRISIDTTKPEVMRAALSLGVWMINDINALLAPGAIDSVKPYSCQLCLMHKKGKPADMQLNPHYSDSVVKVVSDFLMDRIDACQNAGIAAERLWVDPGFGFGKTYEHNLLLLKELEQLMLPHIPMLIGVSRKSMLGEIIKQKSVDLRINAGAIVAFFALQQGVRMIRTHDVKETKEAVLIWQAIKSAS